MASFPCLHAKIARIDLVRAKPIAQRLDLNIWPVAYALTAWWAFWQDPEAAAYRAYGLLVLALVHVLVFLGQVWSPAFQRLVRFDVLPAHHEASLKRADAVFVQPVEHGGRPAIVALQRGDYRPPEELPKRVTHGPGTVAGELAGRGGGSECVCS
jgi:hypothetical protein